MPGLDAQKNTLAASERDEEARAAWREAAAQFDPEQLVFVDESGTNISLTRWCGWAPHDQRATGSAPTLRPGQVVVLDRLSAQKTTSIRQALEVRQCHLLFLPPYSPDFTPIEQAFSKIKAILRQLGARTKETLWEAMWVALEAITPEDAIA